MCIPELKEGGDSKWAPSRFGIWEGPVAPAESVRAARHLHMYACMGVCV